MLSQIALCDDHYDHHGYTSDNAVVCNRSALASGTSSYLLAFGLPVCLTDSSHAGGVDRTALKRWRAGSCLLLGEGSVLELCSQFLNERRTRICCFTFHPGIGSAKMSVTVVAASLLVSE